MILALTIASQEFVHHSNMLALDLGHFWATKQSQIQVSMLMRMLHLAEFICSNIYSMCVCNCVYMFIYPEDPYVQVYFPTFGGFHCKCIGKPYGILGKNSLF